MNENGYIALIVDLEIDPNERAVLIARPPCITAKDRVGLQDGRKRNCTIIIECREGMGLPVKF